MVKKKSVYTINYKDNKRVGFKVSTSFLICRNAIRILIFNDFYITGISNLLAGTDGFSSNFSPIRFTFIVPISVSDLSATPL